MTYTDSIGEISSEDLIALQQHYLNRAVEIAHELARRAVHLELATHEPASDGLDRHGEPDDVGHKATRGSAHRRRRRTIPSVEAVLTLTSDKVKRAAEEIINAGFILEGVGTPMPERPADDRSPRYIRLVWGRQTFAYINVRADHLRIDLPLDRAQVDGLSGDVRVRNVQDKNPWKVSLYVYSDDDVEPAVEALRFVHAKLESGEL
jgi:hypothetical protein